MGAIYTKTRELTSGVSGDTLKSNHLTSHDNIDAEIEDISTALTAIDYTDWADYTPDWKTATGNTGTVGNGTLTSRWMQIGKTVFFYIYLYWGSTTSIGSGVWYFTTPTTPVATIVQNGHTHMRDSDGYTWMGGWNLASTNKIYPLYNVSTGRAGEITSTAPFTWTTPDDITIQGFYETT